MQKGPPDFSNLSPENIVNFQLLLLCLRHCAKCTGPLGSCTFSRLGCPEKKKLWAHVLACDNPACSKPGVHRCSCQEAVQLLKHHQSCKQRCVVCTPAKAMMESIRTHPREAPGQEDWGMEETIIERMRKIHRTLDVLMHASCCVEMDCCFDSCLKVKQLFLHAVSCTQKAEGGCNPCRRLWGVLQLHSRQCRLRICPVPRCQDLRAMAQRRKEYRKGRKDALDLRRARMEALNMQIPQRRAGGHPTKSSETELRMQRLLMDDDGTHVHDMVVVGSSG